MMNIGNLQLRTWLAVMVGVLSITALAESASAQGGFKSKFQRRVVGDVPLTGSVEASLLPNSDPTAPVPDPMVLASNPDSTESGPLGETPESLAPSDHTTAPVDVTKEPVTNEEKMAVLDALIKQQENNIKLMKKELADAQREKRKPDIKKLKQFATATGQRTQAFNSQSQYVKDLIDRFEKEAPNSAQASMLAMGALLGKFEQTHYKIEMSRSQLFIDLVKAEQKKLK